MNTINLTVELGKTDRQLLEDAVALLARLVGQNGDIINLIQGGAVLQPAQETATPDTDHPVDAVSPHAAPEPAAPAEPLYTQAPLYTQDDVRAVVQRLIGPGSTKRAAAQNIVNDYAVKISAIPPDKYAEVMDRLIALEKEA